MLLNYGENVCKHCLLSMILIKTEMINIQQTTEDALNRVLCKFSYISLRNVA